MRYCTLCLQPDTRPGIRFDEDGICPACSYYRQLANVDWTERRNELGKIVSFGQSNRSWGYDSIIGVSGGKDSTRQALFVRNELGMNPLLVCLSYPPQQSTQRGVDNLANLVNHGFDCITIYPAPEVWRKLVRKGFLQYGNWCRSTELALFSSVPRLAVAYQIPLIWWGENPALQLGDLNVMGEDGSDGNQLRRMNTLGGGDISWLMDEEIQARHILQYHYPSVDHIERSGIKICFLGYFWKEWSLLDNGTYSALRGLDVRREPGSEIGDPWGVSSLDEDWVTLNQMIKYLKFGFGRTTEYVNELIRKGILSRQDAVGLVECFDGKCGDQYIQSFCEYIGISDETFWSTVDQFVNTELFERIGMGQYRPRFSVGV